MEHLRDRHRHDPTGLPPTPGEWRHGNLASEPHPYFDRPPGDREVVRHKSFAPGELTIEEAVWDLGMLDYDFFLFVDLDTGDDVMLERAGDGEYLLHRLEPAAEEASDVIASGGETVTVSTAPPPELDVSDAVKLLTNSGELRLFFRNRTSGRGNVVYRRYDGHYGLITPPLDDHVEQASAEQGK